MEPVSTTLGASAVLVALSRSRAARVLIEKVSAAIGLLYEPLHVVRLARAEALAKEIAGEHHIAADVMEQRALARLVQEQTIIQKNLESILVLAARQLSEGAEPSELDDDWIRYFFDKCRLTADSEMQSLWAKILAGEAESTGSFPKSTLHVVSMLSKSDAELFTRLCSFCWSDDLDQSTPLIFEPSEDIYREGGLSFGRMSHLESLGLVHMASLGYFRTPPQDGNLRLSYFGTQVLAKYDEEKGRPGMFASRERAPMGTVIFTDAGRSLQRLCAAQARPGVVEHAIASWAKDRWVAVVI